MRPRVGPHYPRRYAPAHSTCAGALIGARLCINAQTPGSSRENSSHAVPTPRDTVADSVTISRVTQREKRGQISPAIERGGEGDGAARDKENPAGIRNLERVSRRLDDAFRI